MSSGRNRSLHGHSSREVGVRSLSCGEAANCGQSAGICGEEDRLAVSVVPPVEEVYPPHVRVRRAMTDAAEVGQAAPAIDDRGADEERVRGLEGVVGMVRVAVVAFALITIHLLTHRPTTAPIHWTLVGWGGLSIMVTLAGLRVERVRAEAQIAGVVVDAAAALGLIYLTGKGDGSLDFTLLVALVAMGARWEWQRSLGGAAVVGLGYLAVKVVLAGGAGQVVTGQNPTMLFLSGVVVL